jgi:hypothetical protein
MTALWLNYVEYHIQTCVGLLQEKRNGGWERTRFDTAITSRALTEVDGAADGSGDRSESGPTSDTAFGLRREAKRHAALAEMRMKGRRCRRCALPPQSKFSPCVNETAGL